MIYIILLFEIWNQEIWGIKIPRENHIFIYNSGKVYSVYVNYLHSLKNSSIWALGIYYVICFIFLISQVFIMYLLSLLYHSSFGLGLFLATFLFPYFPRSFSLDLPFPLWYFPQSTLIKCPSVIVFTFFSCSMIIECTFEPSYSWFYEFYLFLFSC